MRYGRLATLALLLACTPGGDGGGADGGTIRVGSDGALTDAGGEHDAMVGPDAMSPSDAASPADGAPPNDSGAPADGAVPDGPMTDARPGPCPAERFECGGDCVNMRADPDHCGNCGVRCGVELPGGRQCADGVCQAFDCDAVCGAVDACGGVLAQASARRLAELGDECPVRCGGFADLPGDALDRLRSLCHAALDADCAAIAACLSDPDGVAVSGDALTVVMRIGATELRSDRAWGTIGRAADGLPTDFEIYFVADGAPHVIDLDDLGAYEGPLGRVDAVRIEVDDERLDESTLTLNAWSLDGLVSVEGQGTRDGAQTTFTIEGLLSP